MYCGFSEVSAILFQFMVEENEAQKGNSSKIIELESGGAGIQTVIHMHKHIRGVPSGFKI